MCSIVHTKLCNVMLQCNLNCSRIHTTTRTIFFWRLQIFISSLTEYPLVGISDTIYRKGLFGIILSEGRTCFCPVFGTAELALHQKTRQHRERDRERQSEREREKDRERGCQCVQLPNSRRRQFTGRNG